MKQRTLQNSAAISGIALHTGRRVRLALHPAAPNTGVVFRRIDLPDTPTVPALVDFVTAVQRGTTIARGDAVVHTVEHLLAALYAAGVQNVIVDMEGPEPPVADGSSRPFLDLIESAGLEEQEENALEWRIMEPVFLRFGGVILMAAPADDEGEYRISCTVKYGNRVATYCQYESFAVTAENFRNELSEARTFCLYEEIEALMKANLIAGGSLDNSVVVKDGAILSRDGLRYPDEFVRHKMLDIVGDLSLVGRRLSGHIVAVKPGHSANVALARELRRQILETATPPGAEPPHAAETDPDREPGSKIEAGK